MNPWSDRRAGGPSASVNPAAIPQLNMRWKTFRHLVKALVLFGLVAGGLWLASGSRFRRPAPDVPGALRALRAGDPEPAEAALVTWEGRPQYDSETRLLRGALLLHKGNAGDALLELAPLSPTGELARFVLLWRGECLYRVGRFAEALVDFQQLATLEPENVDGHRWMGAVYFDLGADAQAISELTRVTELDPTDYRPHQLLAILEAESSFIDHSAAIKHYRRALALKPPAEARETLLRGLAKSLIATRDYQAALDVLGKANGDAESSALEAECWWVLGDHRRAEERLKVARSYHPRLRHLLLIEMKMAQADRKPELVISAATAALESDPHDLEFRNPLAMAYRDLGQLAECERELARAQESKKLRDRLIDLNRQAMTDPENAKLRQQLADICEALGKKELAGMWRRAAAGMAIKPAAPALRQTSRGTD